MSLRPLEWAGDCLRMLDQRALPAREEWLTLRTATEVAAAIRDMAVRGAPAIGIAAAYGLALAALRNEDFSRAASMLAESRPTAVNLFWAIERIRSLPNQEFATVLTEAQRIESEDLAMNQAIGRHGAELIRPGSDVLTICNTGALATAGHGTALGIIRTAHAQSRNIHVWSCETRPRLQGLKLTAYELAKEGIPFHAIADSMAASLMQAGRVGCVVVGADRIAANGDTANKIGTYMLAVLARHHQVPFYVAAPSSTIDPVTPTGRQIPIENRVGTEITHIEGVEIAPPGTPTFNPGFDVTPGDLITAIVTEKGVFRAPYRFQP